MPRIIPSILSYGTLLDSSVKSPKQAHAGRINKSTGTRVYKPREMRPIVTRPRAKVRHQTMQEKLGAMLRDAGL